MRKFYQAPSIEVNEDFSDIPVMASGGETTSSYVFDVDGGDASEGGTGIGYGGGGDGSSIGGAPRSNSSSLWDE